MRFLFYKPGKRQQTGPVNAGRNKVGGESFDARLERGSETGLVDRPATDDSAWEGARRILQKGIAGNFDLPPDALFRNRFEFHGKQNCSIKIIPISGQAGSNTHRFRPENPRWVGGTFIG